jgi:hypothetical protein
LTMKSMKEITTEQRSLHITVISLRPLREIKKGFDITADIRIYRGLRYYNIFKSLNALREIKDKNLTCLPCPAQAGAEQQENAE